VKHRYQLFALAAFTICLCIASSAFGATELGDAGDLPATAQDLTAGEVVVIDGSLASGSDQDVYRLCASAGGVFSASTVGPDTAVNTQLFLLGADGRGV
jgi:hypothetical protein